MSKWPKKLPSLSAEQQKIKDDFMAYWHEVLPKKYGIFEKFNQGYVVKQSQGGGRTLDLGAGLGEHINYENLNRQDYYALELRSDMAAVIAKRFPIIKVIVGDCQVRSAFEDNFFDRVLAIHLLEHLPNLPAAIAEVYRVLKPNGKFYVVIPCEGGLVYWLARRISAQRLFEKRYRTSYDFFIQTEHINRPREIIEELKVYFKIKRTDYFPFILPSTMINLAIGLALEPKKTANLHRGD